ncbi:MAG: hypothetical protein KC492_36625 [Myxococcales bacterium]|nr:hypothetical protein [Myxococcales bacterium]
MTALAPSEPSDATAIPGEEPATPVPPEPPPLSEAEHCQHPPKAKGADAWDTEYLRVPEGELSPVTFGTVNDRELDSSVKQLSDVEYVQLEAERARELVDAEFKCPDGEQAYLVRAVAHSTNWGFSANYSRRYGLFVRHRALGRRTPPLRKRALVACLAEAPRQVCPTASVVE